MHPSLRFLVTRPEETRGVGNGPSSYIPSIGHATSAFDVYRTVALSEIVSKPQSWAVTDIDSVAALGRIIDGPITSVDDISKAESAIRAALLYEYAEVFVPTVKAELHNGFISYLRFDSQIRNEASFKAFSCVPCRDHLLALEYVKIKDDEIVSSSNQQSLLIGHEQFETDMALKYLTTRSIEVAASLPLDMKASTHYSGNLYSKITDRCNNWGQSKIKS